MMSLRSGGVCLAFCLVCLPAAAAQQGDGAGVRAENLKTFLLETLETHREMELEFVEAIPDSALRWAPTPGVRDFAQQIEHIVLDNVFFAARAVHDTAMPTFGDSATYLNSKEELRRLADATYDWVIERLTALPAADLLTQTELFRRRIPKWRVYVMGLAHADWTRGQLVPYYRLHGTTPPRWRAP